MQEATFNRYLFLLLVAIIAIGWDFVWTADYYALPLIVNKNELLKAHGYSSTVGKVHSGAGLFFGAFFLIILGAYGAIITYGMCMALASALTYLIPLKVPKESRKHLPGLLSGWRYTLTQNRKLLIISTLVLPLFGFFGTAPTLAITSLFASSFAYKYSLMYSMFYLGSMVIGIILGKWNPRINAGGIILLFYALSGILLILGVLLNPVTSVDAAMWLALGIFYNGRYSIYNTYLQNVTDREMTGRVASNLYTFRGVSSAAGTLSLPLLAGILGSYRLFAFSGLFMVLLAALITVAMPSMTRINVSGE